MSLKQTVYYHQEINFKRFATVQSAVKKKGCTKLKMCAGKKGERITPVDASDATSAARARAGLAQLKRIIRRRGKTHFVFKALSCH